MGHQQIIIPEGKEQKSRGEVRTSTIPKWVPIKGVLIGVNNIQMGITPVHLLCFLLHNSLQGHPDRDRNEGRGGGGGGRGSLSLSLKYIFYVLMNTNEE